MNMLEQAIIYAEHVPVYRLVENTKIPFKGSNGHLEATQDIEQIKAWWTDEPMGNVACVPSKAGIFVLDIDLPKGISTLEDLGLWQRLATQMDGFQGYKSWSGGIHLWFKTDSEIIMKQSQIDLWKDVDIISNGGIIVPPSVVNGKPYEGNLDISQVPKAPEWLVTAIESAIENKGKLVANYSNNRQSRGQSYTGNLLDRIVTGASEGERDNWLTSVCGSLFNLNMGTKNILILMHTINQNYINPPLQSREVEKVFKSILRKENAKFE